MNYHGLKKSERRPAISHARVITVSTLGITQTLAWASSYYLPAMLAVPMARDIGISVQSVFAAFSAALVLAAFLGPLAGRSIGRYGGRPVLVITNLVFALGLAGLALAQGTIVFFSSWLIIGAAMGAGLYEAAFSTAVRLYGLDSRSAITGITLFAGFASTLGWPLSAWLELEFGWRNTCMAWAAIHLFIGLPLNASLPRASAPTEHPDFARPATPSEAATFSAPDEARLNDSLDTHDAQRASLLLAVVFAVTWFISTAMAAHLPRLLQDSGLTVASAVAVSALVGPAQVVARLMEFGLLRRVHPLLSAKIATLLHPLGAAFLVFLGAGAAVPFALLHGAGNGILTIAKGTLPLVIFGPQGYGLRQGILMVPARIAQAASPFIFGFFIQKWGASSLWVSSLLGLMAFTCVLWLTRDMTSQRPA